MLVIDQLKKNEPHLRALAVVVVVAFVMLLAGLWHVQIYSTREYKADLRTQSSRTVRIPAVRGAILDRNGLVLAENRPCYNIGLYIEELSPDFRAHYSRTLSYHQKEAGRKFTRAERTTLGKQTRYQVASNVVAQLGEPLGQPLTLNEKAFQKHYETDLFVPLPVLENLDATAIARFQECSRLPPCFDMEVLPVRRYPHGSTAVHVIGRLQRDRRSMEGELAVFNYRPLDFRGVVGIEGAFDQELRGKAGAKAVLVNHLGYRQSENVWSEAKPGMNVVLTIDLPLQKVAEKALQQAGPNTRGAVVVMDVRNGDVLALVSSPAFDPNIFTGRVSHEDMARLNDERLKPQFNRATQGSFAPGSTLKILTGLAALEVGALNPTAQYTVDPDPAEPAKGAIFVGNRKIRDQASPGKYDLVRAYKRSSNSYFIHESLKPGVLQKMIELGERLHFGERTNIPLNQDTGGHFPDAEMISSGWHPGETANLAIGQGAVDVTPLQLALMMSAVANGGKVLWPRLVDRLEPRDPLGGDAPVKFPPARVRDVLPVSQRNLQLVRNALHAVVEDQVDGTGKEAYVRGMNICGKTGTAQVQQGRRTVDHITWFASFAPLQSPRYAVVVVVQSGASGGGTCAPVARQIYQEIQKREAGGQTHTLARTN